MGLEWRTALWEDFGRSTNRCHGLVLFVDFPYLSILRAFYRSEKLKSKVSVRQLEVFAVSILSTVLLIGVYKFFSVCFIFRQSILDSLSCSHYSICSYPSQKTKIGLAHSANDCVFLFCLSST